MSRLLKAAEETAEDLNLPVTLREIQALNLPELTELSPMQIRRIRQRRHYSQAVTARIYNVSVSTYQKWERGALKPSGSNLKLLNLAWEHGLDYITQ